MNFLPFDRRTLCHLLSHNSVHGEIELVHDDDDVDDDEDVDDDDEISND